MFLDHDIIVLKNMDEFFKLPNKFYMGSDCLPHSKDDAVKNTVVPFKYANAGQMIISPSNVTFNYALQLLQNKEKYTMKISDEEFQKFGIYRAIDIKMDEWVWGTGMQNVFRYAFGTSLLPCHVQSFPDQCILVDQNSFEDFYSLHFLLGNT